jgi:hypothetical protein
MEQKRNVASWASPLPDVGGFSYVERRKDEGVLVPFR